MDATKEFSQSQKLINPKNPNYGPKDVANDDMGKQLVELNEAIC
jgi:hypothetical protein